MAKKPPKAPDKDRQQAKGKWLRRLSTSEIISLISVIIAVAALGFNILDRNREIQAEKFSEANQAFTQITITADISVSKSGEFGKEISSGFHNSSPNPVFDLVLAMPAPLDELIVSADQYHEFRITEDGVEISFPTLPPGEKVEYANTYSSDLFSSRSPRAILNENFRFCFIDVNEQRWLADYRGAQRISSSNECIEDR